MGKTKAKGNGEGTFYKTETGWRGQIYIEGERISRRGKTKQEVIEKLDKLKSDSITGTYAKRSEITVKEWSEIWFEKYVKPSKSEGSYLGYKRLFDNHLLPILGERKLQELSKPMIEEAYGRMFQHKLKKSKEPTYSHSTVNALSVQFKKCLYEAVWNGLLGSNPHEGVHLHKLRPPKKIEAYSKDEHEKIVLYLKTADDLKQIYYFLIATGIRIGEAVALTWEDIDFEKRTININKIIVEISGNPQVEKRTKTDAGTRKIAASQKVLDVLEGLHDRQLEELNFNNLVFPSQRYTIRTQSNLRTMWEKVCATIGVPYKGLHALRHSWATRALENGIDVKTVSVMLGHKNVVTTMNIYQDVLQAHQMDSIDKMDSII